MKRRLFNLLLLFALAQPLVAQNALQALPVYGKVPIAPNAPIKTRTGDSVSIHTLRFYLGNFVLLKNEIPVWENKRWRLLDMDQENSWTIPFNVPAELVFDEIRFNLGTDSLSNVQGAMGGDLDPTNGMYWTWQSGYINFKLEGYHTRRPTRNHLFQLHLGGYQAPFETVQTVRLHVPRSERLQLEFDLEPMLENIRWQEKSSIMSPCAEAANLMRILSQSFRVHEE